MKIRSSYEYHLPVARHPGRVRFRSTSCCLPTLILVTLATCLAPTARGEPPSSAVKAASSASSSVVRPTKRDEKGNYDYLMYDDIEFRNQAVRDELKRWAEWYYEQVKFDGVRLDAKNKRTCRMLNKKLTLALAVYAFK